MVVNSPSPGAKTDVEHDSNVTENFSHFVELEIKNLIDKLRVGSSLGFDPVHFNMYNS